MVVSDINIICVGQKYGSFFEIPRAKFLYFNRDGKYNTDIYFDRYDALRDIKGVWYQLYPQGRDEGDYTCEFLDLHIDLNGEKKIVFLQKDIRTTIINIIDILIYLSPKNEVLFFADLQGYEDSIEKIHLIDFVNKCNKGDLFFNKVYIISRNQSGDG